MEVVPIVAGCPDLLDCIFSNLFDIFYASLSCSLPSPSPKCHNMSAIDYHDVIEGNVVDYVESRGTLRDLSSFLTLTIYT